MDQIGPNGSEVNRIGCNRPNVLVGPKWTGVVRIGSYGLK